MRQVAMLLLLWFVGSGCSRTNFPEAEREFVTALEHLEAINRLLKTDPLFTVEEKLQEHMAAFEAIRKRPIRLTFQLSVRLLQRYLSRLKAAWEGIDEDLQQARFGLDDGILLKVETWMNKMMEKSP
jgi:hypothetical protein